jgi:DNA topoisomerase-1
VSALPIPLPDAGEDPKPAARRLGLRYTADSIPGLTRRRAGKGFAYFDAQGRRASDTETIGRIRSLAIPPAWSEVWICPFENGHLQATGRDAKGRKQAIYHPDWRAHREETKFHRLREFGRALPKLRRRVEADLRRHGHTKEKVVAAVVRLLETTLIRIGNREYARQNGSFGLTTLRMRHLKVGAETLRFQFRGKSGKEIQLELRDRRLARIVRSIQELPGQAIFQYLDDDGARREITSDDVNAYLREAMGSDFTAKEFRTWKATIEALRLMREEGVAAPCSPKIVKEIAKLLGNTPAVCKSSYIHPRLFEPCAEAPEWLCARLPLSSAEGMEPIEKLALERLL